MGVTAIQHRVCVGLYNRAPRKCTSDVIGKYNFIDSHKNDSDFNLPLFHMIGFVIYMYILILILALTLDSAVRRDVPGLNTYMFYSEYISTYTFELSSTSYYNMHVINFVFGLLIHICIKWNVFVDSRLPRLKRLIQYIYDLCALGMHSTSQRISIKQLIYFFIPYLCICLMNSHYSCVA